MTKEECEELLDALEDCKTKEDLEAKGFEPLTVGFANIVCGTVRNGKPLVIKRYTDLVFLRLTPESVGAVDAFAGANGLGPTVFYSSSRGLVMERSPGRTLEEKDMHCGDFVLLDLIAKSLGSFHQLPSPAACEGEPMLWRTIDKMMQVVAKRPELMPEGMPGIDAIHIAINEAREALNALSPKIVLGHGDFKPSNVIRHQDTVTLIDLELGGPNYRGFDLMKVFRTALPTSQECMVRFLRTYAKQVGEGDSDDGVKALLAETQSFEPLTWLEAAIFFLTLPQFKPSETRRWNELAIDRWTKFVETRHKISGKPVENCKSGSSNLSQRGHSSCLGRVGRLIFDFCERGVANKA
jgi:thiamine kinase-like enzyme